MPKVLVLYYSTYGHIETMANAVAEGVRATGATADVKRVPETVPEEIAKGAYFKLDQAAPVATIRTRASWPWSIRRSSTTNACPCSRSSSTASCA